MKQHCCLEMVLRGSLLQLTSSVIVGFLVLTTVESQTITVYPPSVGALNGDVNVYLGCNVTGLTPTYYVQWTYYPAWQSTGILIYTTVNNVNSDTSNFTVYTAPPVGGTQSVDLVINRLKPELAAQYECEITPIPGHRQFINVIALDPLECPSPSGGTIEYDEYSVANISCSVNFYETTLQNLPTIMWYRDGVTVPGVEVILESNTRLTARMAKNVTSLDDNQEFVCVVDFPNGSPDYMQNCSTIFYVLHSVSQIDFYPTSSADAPTQIAVGDTINCTANGRPAPTIEWYDFDYNFLSDLSEMVVTEEMRNWPQPITLYCRANNSIDNGLTVASFESNYTFEVVPGDYFVQTSGVEAWVIAVAVIVPIVVIAAVALIVFFVIRHRKKKKAKAKTTNGSAAARPTTTTTTTTTYSPVPGSESAPYTSVSRPPPTTAPRTTGSITSTRGPPGPDNRNGAAGLGQNPGFGDLGVQTYGGSNQAVNAYPPTRGSVSGSNQALGGGPGVSMNPNPGYRNPNQVLNTSVSTNQRPNYPYTGSNSALNTSLSVGPNPVGAPGVNVSYGRQPSIASSSGRSHASSYNAPIAAMEMNRYPHDLSSMHGSEV